MNCENIINELLGIQDFEIKDVTLINSENTVVFQVEREKGTGYQCSGCGQKQLFAYDHHTTRRVQDFPIAGIKSFIEFRQARVDCPHCKKIIPEKLDWITPYQHQTNRYQRYLAGLCDIMTVADVSDHEGINKDTLYRVDRKYLQERKEKFAKNHPVHYLGIDEISIRKGQKYATVFYDLERREVIALVEGRKRINVSRFFKRWGKENCKQVKAVCTDLWAPYHKSVRIHLKKATLVFDKFHVFKYLSDAVDKVRRNEQQQASEEGKKLLKGSRWIMLKKELSQKQKQKLDEVMQQNENIAKAMLLKEGFSRFYQADTQEIARAVLDEWAEQCKESGLEPFIKLAKRLRRRQDGILAYFEYRITNGIAEGINNKIKVIKRKSYGFRDIHYFFLKILQATGFLPTMKEAYP